MARPIFLLLALLLFAGCDGRPNQPSPITGKLDADVLKSGRADVGAPEADASNRDVDANEGSDVIELPQVTPHDGPVTDSSNDVPPSDSHLAVDLEVVHDGRVSKVADYTRWIVDNTESIAGLALTVSGSPTLTDMPLGKAVCFDGVGDRLIVPQNPIANLARFTVEALFRPDGNGPAEQRMIHMQDDAADGNRAMMETRVLGTQWFLDTYLTSGAASLTLINSAAKHPTDVWYWAALTYDGITMRHYVAGVEDKSGALSFKPIGKGKTGLGMRLTNVSPYKGCIRELRVHPRALSVTELQVTVL